MRRFQPTVTHFIGHNLINYEKRTQKKQGLYSNENNAHHNIGIMYYHKEKEQELYLYYTGYTHIRSFSFLQTF